MTTDVVSRCVRMAGRLPCRTAYSHVTAGVLHGLPVPPGLLAALHVTGPRGAYLAEGDPFVLHEREHPAAPDRRHGVPVVPVAEAWCGLTAQVSFRDAVVAGDAVVRALGGIAPLREHVAGRGSGPGTAAARRALRAVRAGALSPDETRLRLAAAQAGLPEPVLGVHVGGRAGRVALGWPEVALAVRIAPGTRVPELRVRGRWRLLTVPPGHGGGPEPGAASCLGEAYLGRA